MPIFSATAIAHPNIALIKYWGDFDNELHLPANGSISMNLSGLITRTMVSFIPSLQQDQFIFNGEVTIGTPLERVSTILEHVRQLAGTSTFARVESKNNFPVGAGIASSFTLSRIDPDGERSFSPGTNWIWLSLSIHSRWVCRMAARAR
jgi:diphosphomevalonate decarboxylase